MSATDSQIDALVRMTEQRFSDIDARLTYVASELHTIRKLSETLAVLAEQMRAQNDGLTRAFRAIDSVGEDLRTHVEQLLAAERERHDLRIDLERAERKALADTVREHVFMATPRLTRVTYWQGALSGLAVLLVVTVGIASWTANRLFAEIERANAAQDHQISQILESINRRHVLAQPP